MIFDKSYLPGRARTKLDGEYKPLLSSSVSNKTVTNNDFDFYDDDDDDDDYQSPGPSKVIPAPPHVPQALPANSPPSDLSESPDPLSLPFSPSPSPPPVASSSRQRRQVHSGPPRSSTRSNEGIPPKPFWLLPPKLSNSKSSQTPQIDSPSSSVKEEDNEQLDLDMDPLQLDSDPGESADLVWEDPEDVAFTAQMESGERAYTYDDLMEYTSMTSASMPRTYKEAINRDDGHLWQEASQKEYNALIDNGTWVLTKLPKDRKTIGGR